MKFINVFKPKVTLKDIYFVLINLIKGNISGTSHIISDFEKKFAVLNNTKFCVALSNGSIALEAAFEALDLEEGSEVILPSHSIISCLSPILRRNLIPVFCDVDINSWNTNVENIREVYSEKTKAIILVHTYGLSAQAEEITNFAKENNILIIEDAAEAHGQTYNGRTVGSFGDISTFSFYANKHITMGEGGAICTDNYDYYKKIKQIINLDFTNEKRFYHNNLYWNYRLSGLQASLGLSQISYLNKTIKNKIKQGNNYLNLLKDYSNLMQLPLQENLGQINHFWVFGVVLKKNEIRDEVIKNLLKLNIETRPFFWPLHLQPLIRNYEYKTGKLNNSEIIGKNGLYLPMGSHINFQDQKFIVKKLIEILVRFN